METVKQKSVLLYKIEQLNREIVKLEEELKLLNDYYFGLRQEKIKTSDFSTKFNLEQKIEETGQQREELLTLIFKRKCSVVFQ